MDQCDSSEEPDEIRRALAGLLTNRGVACSEDDLAVIEVETRGGYPYFVILGLNGTERLLGKLIARVAGRRRTSVGASGVFLLRPGDLQRLVSKITA